MKNKKTFALIRALAAFLAAVILVAVTGFAFVDMLSGGDAVTDGGELTGGAYVQTDLTFIMDICGVEKNAAGDAVSYYVVAPIGNKFAVIRFPASDFDSVSDLQAQTMAYLEGSSSSMGFHMLVTGVVEESSATVDRLLTQWFTDNAEWMSSSGVIGTVDDYDSYLCEYTLNTERVGTMSYTAALVLTVIALVLLAYAIVEVVLVIAGVYSKKPAKKTAKEKKSAAAKPAVEAKPAEAQVPGVTAAADTRAEPVERDDV